MELTKNALIYEMRENRKRAAEDWVLLKQHDAVEVANFLSNLTEQKSVAPIQGFLFNLSAIL